MKYLAEIEADRIRFTKLKRRIWQMVSTRNGRLYWVADEITVKNRGGDDALVIYPGDGQQPMTCNGTQLDPDLIRVYIDSCKNSGTKRDIWGSVGKFPIEKVLMIVIVVGAFGWYGLSLLGI